MDLLPIFTEEEADGLQLPSNDTAVSFAIMPEEDYTQLFVGFPPGLLYFASICCVFFMIVGIPGNLITIVALALSCKKARNATAVFIMNLSLSDLLFCCVNLPLAASTFYHRGWVHGEFACRLFPLFRYGLLAVSLFTILTITINRYIMISHPRIYPKLFIRRNLVIIVTLTWVFAFASLIQTWRGRWGMFGLDVTVSSCSILPSKGRSPKEFLFIMAFVLPITAILLCYARIFYIVRKAAIKTQDSSLHTNGSVRHNHDGTKKHKKNKKAEENRELQKIDNVDVKPLAEITNFEHPRKTFAKMTEDELKFIDTSIDSDLPPTLSSLQRSSMNVLEGPGITSKACSSSMRNSDSLSPDTGYEGWDRSPTPNTDSTSVGINIEDVSKSFEDRSRKTSRQEQNHQNDPEAPEQNLSPNNRSVRHKKRRLNNEGGTQRKKSLANTSGASILVGKLTSKDRRLLKMILVIFLSFIFCYAPITATKVWKSMADMHVVFISGYLLVYLTTCINPIIYVVMSSEYRKAYKNLLKSVFFCRSN